MCVCVCVKESDKRGVYSTQRRRHFTCIHKRSFYGLKYSRYSLPGERKCTAVFPKHAFDLDNFVRWLRVVIRLFTRRTEHALSTIARNRIELWAQSRRRHAYALRLNARKTHSGPIASFETVPIGGDLIDIAIKKPNGTPPTVLRRFRKEQVPRESGKRNDTDREMPNGTRWRL